MKREMWLAKDDEHGSGYALYEREPTEAMGGLWMGIPHAVINSSNFEDLFPSLTLEPGTKRLVVLTNTEDGITLRFVKGGK